MEHEDIGVEEYPTNWSEWPVGHRPDSYGGIFTTWQDTRWLTTHNVPWHLLNVFLIVYDEIEKHFGGGELR